jgi:hypothetical protein
MGDKIMKKRASGILLHISSLPGDYGIGDLGKEAYNFVDFLAKAKQTYWQVLPLGVTGFGDSPYQCFSAFAGNPYFIDLNDLIQLGYLTESRVREFELSRDPDRVDYELLYKNKIQILRMAYEVAKTDIWDELELFYNKNRHWLRDFLLFMSIKTEYSGISWLKWGKHYKDSSSDAVSDLAPLDQQAAMLHEIFPDAQKVGIIYCSAEPNSKYQDKVITEHLTGMGYSVKSYTFSDSNDLQTIAKAAISESDVIYLPTDNTIASNTEIIKNIALPAKVPIIAGEEGICSGSGGVATLSISYYDLGYTTGEMAYEILVNGTDPATMEIQYAPKFTKKYNPDVCDTLGITLSSEYEAL